MPPIDRPPISPQAQAQMGPPGPPGGPGFGPGIGAAQNQDKTKNDIDMALKTVEKILQGVSNDTFQGYVTQAMNILRGGAVKATAGGPQSPAQGAPPPGAGPPGAGPMPPPQPQLPPSAGMMPG